MQGRGGAADPLSRTASVAVPAGQNAGVCAMKEIRRQNFVVVEGSVIVGSFVTLQDALAFRAKSGTISARIMADHGEFDEARLHAAEPNSASVELSVEQP
ncbi:MAG: hypothetical protein DME22_09540 [Verrucomicrobia bacterium]|nr:MAG: hypothetical protein DME22_09540 [Verrucomicrobiota bacterium]